MTGWIIAIALAAITFAALLRVFRLPRGGREVAGVAIVAGLLGYALQGSPGEAGRPTAARVDTPDTTIAGLIALRQAMGNPYGAGRDYLITADAFARAGHYADAAKMLRGAIRNHPGDADLWLALGNALVGHSDGLITPGARYAYRQAATIAPGHPGVPLFLGTALAQSGEFREARAAWQGLLDMPGMEDAPWRAELSGKIARLDALIAMREGADPPGSAPLRSGPVPVAPPAGGSPAAADTPPSPMRPGT